MFGFVVKKNDYILNLICDNILQKSNMNFYSVSSDFYHEIFPFNNTIGKFLAGYAEKSSRGILDIGCGTGNYSGFLSVYSNRLTGIDFNTHMLETAAKRFPGINFMKMDINSLSLPDKSFDLAFCIGNVIAYLKPEAMTDFFRKIKKLLTDEGIFIFQTVNRDKMPESGSYDFTPKLFSEGEGVFSRKYLFNKDGTIEFQTKLEMRGNEIYRGSEMIYLLKSSEYSDILEKSGLRLISHYGNYNKAPFDSGESAANIMVAGK